MKKLPLLIKESLEFRTDELQNLKRYHNSVIINSWSDEWNKKNSGSDDDSPESTFDFTLLRRRTERSETDLLPGGLKFLRYQFGINGAGPPLESLKIINSHWNIMGPLLPIKNIKKLRIDAPPVMWLNLRHDCQYLDALMAEQEQLETLIITNYFPLIYEPNSIVKYNLKQLSMCHRVVHGSIRDRTDMNDCLLDIMERHQDTLENLEICVNGEHLMIFIMKNLKVRRLFVTAALPSTCLHICEEIQPNLHLKKLIIGGQIRNIRVLNRLVETYPTVESLIIKDWQENVTNEDLIVIASTLKSLYFLHIPTLTFNTPDAEMPSLRIFNVDFLDEIEDFLVFCFNIPSVETLGIKRPPLETFTTENIQIITSRLPQLRHIKLGHEFEFTTEIFNILSRNCPHLRLIEMLDYEHSYNRNYNFKHGKIDVIYFPEHAIGRVFCREKSLWSDNFD